MKAKPPSFDGLSLFTQAGERKYLSADERKRFLAALTALENPADRTYCEMLYWTGCRASEALALSALAIDLDEAVVVIRSLKKRGRRKGQHFRQIPVPRDFARRLDAVHRLMEAQARPDGGRTVLLWPMGRTTAWKRVKTVMKAAGISGERACPKGLRHGYGVHAAVSQVPETRIKKWLGHESLATTEIYLDIAGPEDRAIASRMWRCGPEAG